MDYPKQERGGNSQRGTVAPREIVNVFKDAASGGSSNPDYSSSLGANIPAEVLQVSGGEIVRGKQVEANTTFVVSIRYLPGVDIDSKCKVDILSGVYSGKSVFTHRVHFETARGRPVGMQLHGRMREDG